MKKYIKLFEEFINNNVDNSLSEGKKEEIKNLSSSELNKYKSQIKSNIEEYQADGSRVTKKFIKDVIIDFFGNDKLSNEDFNKTLGDLTEVFIGPRIEIKNIKESVKHFDAKEKNKDIIQFVNKISNMKNAMNLPIFKKLSKIIGKSETYEELSKSKIDQILKLKKEYEATSK